MAKVYGPEEKTKLEKLIKEGSLVLQEIEDLKTGLKETVDAIAEQMDLKPGIINKAIKIAHKGNWQDHAEANDEIEAILSITKNI